MLQQKYEHVLARTDSCQCHHKEQLSSFAACKDSVHSLTKALLVLLVLENVCHHDRTIFDASDGISVKAMQLKVTAPLPTVCCSCWELKKWLQSTKNWRRNHWHSSVFHFGFSSTKKECSRPNAETHNMSEWLINWCQWYSSWNSTEMPSEVFDCCSCMSTLVQTKAGSEQLLLTNKRHKQRACVLLQILQCSPPPFFRRILWLKNRHHQCWTCCRCFISWWTHHATCNTKNSHLLCAPKFCAGFHMCDDVDKSLSSARTCSCFCCTSFFHLLLTPFGKTTIIS